MKQNASYDFDSEINMNTAKDVRDTKMLDADARETRDEGPNDLKTYRVPGGKPKPPFGMHK